MNKTFHSLKSEAIYTLWYNGFTAEYIAVIYGLSAATIQYHIKRAGGGYNPNNTTDHQQSKVNQYRRDYHYYVGYPQCNAMKI